MNLDPYSRNGLGSHGSSGSSRASADEIFVKSKHGGAGRRAAPAEVSEPMEIPEAEPAPVDEKLQEPKAILSEGKWWNPKTLFNEEAEVSVNVSLPPGKEHLTRIEAEVHSKTPKGLELIAKGEAHAQANGTASFSLPVYKPNGHEGGPVDYFLVFKHKLADVFKPDSLIRKVSEMALKSADHVLVPGIAFPKDGSFIRPQAAEALKNLESRFKQWESDHPKAKIVVFGHANPDEKDPKALSERRAQSAFAFITNDAATWEKIYQTEKWPLVAFQNILLDLGHFNSKPDNLDGQSTQTAFKAFQKKHGLVESGKHDTATRKAMFTAYMGGKHDIKIEADRFRKVSGQSWMGCGSHNLAKEGKEPAPENRRVAFILIKESRFFPVNFPCQDGKEGACESQCKKPGKRTIAGTACLFYDELVREQKQAEHKEENEADELDELMKKAHLDSKDIAKARGLIKNRPEAKRPGYYTRLQGKVKYKSQRDNSQTTDIADRMCNLTSLAMALEYLGVENPEPSMQFEDHLEKIRKEKGYPERIDSHSWDKLADGFNIGMSAIELMTTDPAILKLKLKPEIEKGHGVIISIFSSKSERGHIVRLQSVQDDGLIVDDPFGRLNNFKQRENKGSGYTGTANTRNEDSHLGEDNLWTWENIGETVIKYAEAFHCKE